MYTVDPDLTNFANYTMGRCDISALNVTTKVLNSLEPLGMSDATQCRYTYVVLYTPKVLLLFPSRVLLLRLILQDTPTQLSYVV